jgi:hypothetical protein
MDPVLAGNCSCIATIHTIHGDHNGVTECFVSIVSTFPGQQCADAGMTILPEA